jgi:hypothetical protein
MQGIGMEKEYQMTISRTTIDKLGIKLYDSPSAVVSELIANSYDADSETVHITIPLDKWLATKQEGRLVDKGYEITIVDTGHGMEPSVINDFYLKIGTDARKDARRGPYSLEKKRPRMGRKGIGKLAPFGICRKIEVITAGGPKNGTKFERAHLILDYDKINQESDERYYPTLGKLNHTFTDKRGTTIRLSDFLFRRTPDAETFLRQVSRRFGLEQADFKITVTDSSTDETHQIKDLAIDIDEDTKIVLNHRPVPLSDGTEMPVRGWVAYAKEPYSNPDMAGIRMYARGKFIGNAGIFDLHAGFTGEYTIRSYIVGVVHVDWLDSDDNEDLIRSDRQDILWSSEYGEALKTWGQILVKELGKTAYPAKKRKVAAKFLEISKIEEIAKERFGEQSIVDTAVEIGRVLGRGLNEENIKDTEYVNGIMELALSIAPHKTIVDELKKAEKAIAERPLEAIAKLFNNANLAERASLGMIVQERLHNISKLDKIPSTAAEGELQQLLESAPWMIDPRWTMLQANQSFTNFRKHFQKWYKEHFGVELCTTSIGTGSRRPDFIMLHVGTNIEIVEIKAKEHLLENNEYDRIEMYYSRIQQYLDENKSIKEQFPKVHVTLVCDGLNLKGVHIGAYQFMEKENHLIRRRWDEIMMDSETVNKDFLEESRRITSYRAVPHS